MGACVTGVWCGRCGGYSVRLNRTETPQYWQDMYRYTPDTHRHRPNRPITILIITMIQQKSSISIHTKQVIVAIASTTIVISRTIIMVLIIEIAIVMALTKVVL